MTSASKSLPSANVAVAESAVGLTETHDVENETRVRIDERREDPMEVGTMDVEELRAVQASDIRP